MILVWKYVLFKYKDYIIITIMKKVLIFGSSGFLGKKVLKLVSEKEYNIDTVDLEPSNFSKNNISFNY